MAISVVMPALEMAQETGTLLAWRKQAGERVIKGEPLLEIETDKAVVEIEATADGILEGVTSQPGDIVAVGTVIAWILQPGESLPKEISEDLSSRASTGATQAISEDIKTAPARMTAAESSRVSPKARRLAQEHGVDITLLHGSGPEGIITADDVLAAKNTAAAYSATSGDAKVPLSAIARIMAERTTQSWTTVPHFFVIRDADAGALLDYQKKSKTTSAPVSLTDCLISVVARTLERHPALNSSWTGDSIRTNPDINLSLAIAVKDGVIAPVIHRANSASLAEIAARRASLVERARTGKTLPADLTGGTFTISNLGMFKVELFTAIITPPQVAILAVGAVTDRVIAQNGEVIIRPMMTLVLSSDHRVVDGATAAAFLVDLVEALQDPQKRS
jgi:pyruvate dehydrogenase E2 component (dihydrolipoamide acetyltransferase)